MYVTPSSERRCFSFFSQTDEWQVGKHVPSAQLLINNSISSFPKSRTKTRFLSENLVIFSSESCPKQGACVFFLPLVDGGDRLAPRTSTCSLLYRVHRLIIASHDAIGYRKLVARIHCDRSVLGDDTRVPQPVCVDATDSRVLVDK